MMRGSHTPEPPEWEREFDRREFLKKSCLAAGAAGTMSAIPGAVPRLTFGEEIQGEMEYRRLGRTELDISVVVAGEMQEPFLHERAFDLGVNYWHKMGEFAFPEVFNSKDRDSFYCDMVIDTLNREGAIAQFEWGLKHSGLEMIDFIKIHSLYREPDDLNRSDGLFEAFEHLKKQGKTRFLSIAQHVNTAEVLTACIESGMFDAIQPNFNVMSGPAMHDLMALAEKHDIGVICKKVMIGGAGGWQRRGGLHDRVAQFLDERTTIGQALIRWTLDVPGVTAVVPRINTLQHLEENVAAGFSRGFDVLAGRARNQRALQVLVEDLDTDYCRSCGTCEKSCPIGIPIPDIMRFEMYYSGYGLESEAREIYRGIPASIAADTCDGCGSCEEACPHGLPIITKLKEIHALLS